MGLILLVSEDLVEIETVKAALSVHGWWVTVAADRQVALQVAADQAPKLVLVDHDLPDAIELLRSFGSINGGPGVVALVAADFEGGLELKEAGADELLSKPAAPPAVLEAVQRCLAAPRPGAAERRARSDHLLTTEEIFGDVLREIGEGAAHPAGGARTAPEPTPAGGRAGDLLAAPRASERAVSLAGLFDDPPAAGEPPTEWRGEERRAADRPWSSGRTEAPVAVPSEPMSSEPELAAASADDEADTVVVSTSDAAPEPPPVGEPTVPVAEPLDTGELDGEALPPWAEPAAARRRPRSLWVLGGLAATLLVAVGAVFVLEPDAEPRGAARAPATTVGQSEPAVSAASAPGTERPEPVASAAADGDPASVAEPATAAPAGPEAVVAPPVEVEELDIEAIVDQELERREEALRRVFLEEEKRLLRELNDLDRERSQADDEAESDAGGPPGAGS